MKRPSHYVLLCAVLVLATFSASGHLRVAPLPQRPASAPAPARIEAAHRGAELLQITGSVIDTMGFRLAGAEVAVGAQRTQTDGDGRFRLDVPRAAFATLLLRATGHRARELSAWPAAGEPIFAQLEPAAPWDDAASVAAAPPVSLGLAGEGLVRGRDGAPIAGALVFVAQTQAMARTDVAGHYEIALPETSATLLVHQPEGGDDGRGFAGRSEPIAPERRTGRVPLPDIVATAGVALRGTVRDGSGQPQPGVPIQLVGDGFARTIASGEGGVFRLSGLLPGSYELRVFAFRGGAGERRQLDLAGPITDVELQLRTASERRLQVVTQDGAPVARAVVATAIDGVRREVVHGDDAGFIEVRSAESTLDYDVRGGDGYRPLRVLARPEADGRLVVALP